MPDERQESFPKWQPKTGFAFPVARGGDAQFVLAVARAFQILRCFDSNHRELGTTELAGLTGLPQPTIWRLCHTLVELGYLAPTVGGDKLRVAAGILGLGQSALAGTSAVEAIKGDMQELADATRTAVSFSIYDETEMRILARVHSSGTLLFNFSPGATLPLAASASGWAVLATLKEPENAAVRAYLAKLRGEAWPALWRAASAAIADLPKQGYVISRGAIHPDMLGLAVPIFAGGSIYTISAGAPLKDVAGDRVRKVIGPRLLRLAKIVAAAVQGVTPL